MGNDTSGGESAEEKNGERIDGRSRTEKPAPLKTEGAAPEEENVLRAGRWGRSVLRPYMSWVSKKRLFGFAIDRCKTQRPGGPRPAPTNGNC
jgi:hypothetical protein